MSTPTWTVFLPASPDECKGPWSSPASRIMREECDSFDSYYSDRVAQQAEFTHLLLMSVGEAFVAIDPYQNSPAGLAVKYYNAHKGSLPAPKISSEFPLSVGETVYNSDGSNAGTVVRVDSGIKAVVEWMHPCVPVEYKYSTKTGNQYPYIGDKPYGSVRRDKPKSR